MKTCPVCGEKYADTYKRCPFCEEDVAPERVKMRRKGGRRASNGGGGRPLLAIILVIIALIILFFVAKSLFGDKIDSLFGGGTPGTSQTDGEGEQKPNTGDTDNTDGEGTEPDPDGAVKPNVDDLPDDEGGDGQSSGDDGSNPNSASGSETATAITLSKEDVTLPAGESFTLKAEGGNGKAYSFKSENTAIATVDSKGVVTGVSNGIVDVTVTSGGKSAVCIVRVKGGTAGTTTVTGGKLTLNKDDITLSKSESFQLSVSGGSDTKWYVEDTNIATIDENTGKVTAVKSGKTTVTVVSGSSRATCIVRVK